MAWACQLCLDCASLSLAVLVVLEIGGRCFTVQAGLAVQEGVFLDRATC